MPANSESAAFRYPPRSHVRRHGPRGYAGYESFRPWLRDEFSFRCVYCLIREQWGRITAEFDLDHFIPQAVDRAPDLAIAKFRRRGQATFSEIPAKIVHQIRIVPGKIQDIAGRRGGGADQESSDSSLPV